MTTMSTSTLGEKKGHVRITLRKDIAAGVSLGGGVDLMPGETADVPFGLAQSLLATGRARFAPAAEISQPDPADPDTPEEHDVEQLETNEPPTPQTPDPKPSVAAPPPRKRR